MYVSGEAVLLPRVCTFKYDRLYRSPIEDIVLYAKESNSAS